MGKRTRIQIEFPDIIKKPRPQEHASGVVQATKDEELGTDKRHGMIATTAGLGTRTIGHDAGPLSRCWNRRSSDQLPVKWVLTSKDPTCRGREDIMNHRGHAF